MEDAFLQNTQTITELDNILRHNASDVADLNERHLIVHCVLHLLMRDHSDLAATTTADHRSTLDRVLRWRAQQQRSER